MAIATFDVVRQITDFIQSEFRVGADDPDFGPDVNLFEEGYVDSTGLVELIAFLESTFDVQLGEEQLFSEAFTSIHGISSVVAAAMEPAVPRAAVSESPASAGGPVRAWTRADVPAVAALYEQIMRSGTRNAPPGLAGYFESWFLDHPFADPECPSLVYEDADGRIRGFFGAHVRRFTFDGAPLRAVCSGQLVVDRESRSKGVGAHLLRAMLGGAQDFTFTDGGTTELRNMWTGLGGQAVPAGYVRWSRVFKPGRLAADVVKRRTNAPLAIVGRTIGASVDYLTKKWFRAKETTVQGEVLTPQEMMACLEELAPHYRVSPTYDEPFLDWMFTELRRVTSRGTPRAICVRDGDERIGTYVYYAAPGEISRVLQVAATPEREADVLSHLISDAERQGAHALQGRADPSLLKALYSLDARIDFDASLQLLHCKDRALSLALLEGDALMTRLEGEWWAGFQLEPFASPILSKP